MEQNKSTTEKLPDFYRTGDVQPPKNYRQIITLLLLLVLFLGCLVSALSFANIHLFRLLEETEKTSLSFDVCNATTPEQGTEFPALGITGCFLSEFEQQFFALPQGMYITYAAHPELQAGDVLMSINGSPLTDDASLSALLDALPRGTALTMEIRRGDNTFTTTHTYEGKE